MNSEDGQVYSVCILQFSCFTKYNRMQSKHKQTKCEQSRRNSNRLQLSQQVSIYLIKELFIKTISNSSLNSHVYWDTLYINLRGRSIKRNLSHFCLDLILLFLVATMLQLGISNCGVQSSKQSTLKTTGQAQSSFKFFYF